MGQAAQPYFLMLPRLFLILFLIGGLCGTYQYLNELPPRNSLNSDVGGS